MIFSNYCSLNIDEMHVAGVHGLVAAFKMADDAEATEAPSGGGFYRVMRGMQHYDRVYLIRAGLVTTVPSTCLY